MYKTMTKGLGIVKSTEINLFTKQSSLGTQCSGRRVAHNLEIRPEASGIKLSASDLERAWNKGIGHLAKRMLSLALLFAFGGKACGFGEA